MFRLLQANKELERLFIRHTYMHKGELTVSGKGSISIPLTGRPHEVFVRFKHEHHHPTPCDHHEHDLLSGRITSVDEDMNEHHRLGHEHHDRQFFISIEWDVSAIREVAWHVIY